MIIRIKRRIWSQNARDKTHWSGQRRERDAWKVHLLAKLGGMQEPPRHRRYLIVTSYRAQLITDHGNLVGGAKDLIDALVHVGLLRDDADQWASIRYEQRKCPRVDEHTAIEVDDLEVTPTPAQRRRAERQAARIFG